MRVMCNYLGVYIALKVEEKQSLLHNVLYAYIMF